MPCGCAVRFPLASQHIASIPINDSVDDGSEMKLSERANRHHAAVSHANESIENILACLIDVFLCSVRRLFHG